jgi:hypothetical protein
LKQRFISDTISDMKRETNEKKNRLAAQPKMKVSAAESANKKIQTDVRNTELTDKKSSAKLKASVKTDILPAKKKVSAVNSKGNKQSVPAINQKTVKQALKIFAKQTEKPKLKIKPTEIKEKIIALKTQKKSAESKNKKVNKKIAPIKQDVKSVALKKVEAKKIEKPVAVKKVVPVVQNSKLRVKGAKPKVEDKTIAKAKIETSKANKTKQINLAQRLDSQTKPNVSVKKGKTSLPQKAVPEVVAAKKKIVNKKAKPISSAVLRGKSGKYDFEVFPLDANFEAISAIYVISKRTTDKRKRGHHKLVCIGQTESIADGIKEHKKDKCIKQFEANVVCLLKEESEKNRLKIAADLREAHQISCNRQ